MPEPPGVVFGRARQRFSGLRDGFVFLDAPGGTQVPDEVGEAVARVYREAGGNTGAPYATSRRLDRLVEQARAETARFLGCASDEIIFGASSTALNYMLTRTLGRELRAGDEIVVTRLDHDGNVAPWLDLARDLGVRIRHADVRADTTLDLSDLERQLSERTRVVAFPWAANSVGTIVDAAAVCELAHQAGALAWIDAVQYAPHQPIDCHAVGADVLFCSAYKFCGPHLAIAFGRRDLLASWQPYKARPVPREPLGHSFETGTLPYELLAGLVAALGYHHSLGGMPQIARWEHQLGDRLLAGLPPGANLYGLSSMAGRVPTFLVNFDGVPSSRLSADLAERGFGVWSHGSYYALGLHDRIGWGEALRIGLAHYNTLEEVDRFSEVLAELVRRPPATAAARTTAGPHEATAGTTETVAGTATTAAGTTETVAGTATTAAGTTETVAGTATTAADTTAAHAVDPEVRVLLEAGPSGLVSKLVRVPPGSRLDGAAEQGGELWFVLAGTGTLTFPRSAALTLGPDQGLLLPPDLDYQLTASGHTGLRIDAVALPAAADHAASSHEPLARRAGDCDAEVTGDRQFRVLFGPGRDCAAATQFVGEIPPGRAPDHSHPYDELVLVLDGEGIGHVGGVPHPLAPGVCLHLPPGVTHCLENTGTGPLRVRGVFHPAGSPAAKLREGTG